MELKVVTGRRYPGGFIGEIKADKSWLARKLVGWAEYVETLTEFFRKHLHSTYTGLQKSLQKEWAFMQRVTLGIGDAFDPV